jgi:hypothetical protein
VDDSAAGEGLLPHIKTAIQKLLTSSYFVQFFLVITKKLDETHSF